MADDPWQTEIDAINAGLKGQQSAPQTDQPEAPTTTSPAPPMGTPLTPSAPAGPPNPWQSESDTINAALANPPLSEYGPSRGTPSDSILPAAPYDATNAAVHGLTLGLSDVARSAEIAGHRYLTGQTPDFDYAQAAREVQRGREAYANQPGSLSVPANLAGGIAGPVGPAMSAIKAASPLGRAALSTLTGGLIGGVQGAADNPVSVSDALEGARIGAEWGAGTGAAFPVAGYVGGKILPELTPDARVLRAAGVQPTPGSAVGGLPGAVENLFSHIPIVGAPIQAGRAAATEQLETALTNQKDSFVRGAVNQPLARIGESLNADTAAGHDAIAEMQQKLTNAYTQAVPTAGGALDAQASRTLGDSIANAKLNLPDSQAKQFENFVQTNVYGKIQGTTEADATSALTAATTAREKAAADLSAAQNNAMRTPGPGSDINVANATTRLAQANAAESQAQRQLGQAQTSAPFGTLSGQDFQDVDRQLGQKAHAYLKSPDPDQHDLGDAYLNLQGQLRGWLERVSPQNAADLKAANEAWRMAKPVEGAARRTNDPNGIFTDRDLQIASRTASTTPQFAAGGALMQRFAGNAMMQRNALEDASKSLAAAQGAHGAGVQGAGVAGGVVGAELLTHGPELLQHPWLIGGTALGYPAMMAAYSNPGRRAITSLLGGLSTVPRAISYAGPTAGQFASGLLTNPPDNTR